MKNEIPFEKPKNRICEICGEAIEPVYDGHFWIANCVSIGAYSYHYACRDNPAVGGLLKRVKALEAMAHTHNDKPMTEVPCGGFLICENGETPQQAIARNNAERFERGTAEEVAE